MLIHEGSTRFHVALGADHVLIGGGQRCRHVVVSNLAVRIVAVRALDKAFIHLVMEGHGEERLDVGVALEAKSLLAGLQQDRVWHGLMDAVAAQAANTGPGMRGTEEVGVGIGVATKAGRINLPGRELVEPDDLGDIATAIDMSLAWAVAAFADDASSAVQERLLVVGVLDHLVSCVLMTGCTGVIPDIPIVGALHRRGGRMLQGLGLGGRHASTACGQNPDQRNQKEKHRNSAGQMPHTKTPLSAELVLFNYLRSAKP
jgi:hypothetical protein